MIPKWCLLVEVEVGIASTGGAGGVYYVEGEGMVSTGWNGPREEVSQMWKCI
jgi:hypothetical protein